LLSLTDPKWSELKSTYGNGIRVAELLSLAKGGAPSPTWYDELFQELLHQYTVSEAAYAAIPHLVEIADEREELREQLLMLIGACYAFSQTPEATPITAELEENWRGAARQAIPIMGGVLGRSQPSQSNLRYLFSSLAALNGHYSLAVVLEALDSEIECPHCWDLIDLTRSNLYKPNPPETPEE
jgi:hypothetical protein